MTIIAFTMYVAKNLVRRQTGRVERISPSICIGVTNLVPRGTKAKKVEKKFGPATIRAKSPKD
jgi:hypothetical protein